MSSLQLPFSVWVLLTEVGYNKMSSKCNKRDWEDGSFSKVLVTQAWGPEFDAQDPWKMLGMVVHTCNLRATTAGTGESLELSG